MAKPSEYAILDRLLEGCQIIGFDYRYLYVNEAVARHGRKTVDELIGRTMMEVYPGIDSTPMFATLEACMRSRQPAEFENHFAYDDGTSAWFALKMEPVPEGLFILSVDISPRKQAEFELRNQINRLEALHEIDMAIISTTDLSQALKAILTRVIDSLKVDAADILLLDPHSLVMEYAEGRGFRSQTIKQYHLHLGQGLAGRAALERKIVSIPNISESQESVSRSALLTDEGFISYFGVPLIARGNLVGVLEIFHRSEMQVEQSWLDFLNALGAQASIAIESGRLYGDLKRLNVDLMLAYNRTIEGWSRALELRDRETEGHSLRVTEMTVRLARMSGMPESDIAHLRRGALLHDIGKLGIPDEILRKPAALTEAEWEIIRMHPVYAFDLLYPVEYLRPCLDIPYAHHEKWDGTGYPRSLAGEQIPLAARLFAVVDVWDALSYDRPYRRAWPQEKVLAYIREQSGVFFEPGVVDLFLQALEEQQREARQGES